MEAPWALQTSLFLTRTRACKDLGLTLVCTLPLPVEGCSKISVMFSPFFKQPSRTHVFLCQHYSLAKVVFLYSLLSTVFIASKFSFLFGRLNKWSLLVSSYKFRFLLIVSIVNSFSVCLSLNDLHWTEETTQGAGGGPAVAVYRTAAEVSVVFLSTGNLSRCHWGFPLSHWHLFTLSSCGCVI